MFTGGLFIANASFNNLHRPRLATAFNFARVLLGIIPAVWFGSQWYGARGVIAGEAVGSIAFGLLGVMLLLTLYLLVILRGAYISLNARDSFGRLAAGSITLTFFVYVLVNMGMVSGMLPVVGVPLPLVSYGGTALVTLLASFGVLMAVATEPK